MSLDLSRWAVVSPKDDTGFGRMAGDARRVLGLGRQIVIPSERLSDHPLEGASDRLLRPDDPETRVVEVLEGVEGILFFERHGWHPRLLATARRLGVKTVCVPMWEWFRSDAPEWAHCDLFVCPSRMTEAVVRRGGWTNTVVLPWVVDLARFPERKVRGPARVFLHNAGLIDADDRKGTRETIAAFLRVKNPALRLVVRMQKPAPLPPLDERIEVRVGNLDDPAGLYAEGDCAIQPSKMEGLGFMVLEPVVSGLAVVTLDYPPMSEIVAQPEMRVSKRWFKRRAFPTAWVKHAHLRLPDRRDLGRKIEWCAANDLTGISCANRAWAEKTFARESLRESWARALGTIA